MNWTRWHYQTGFGPTVSLWHLFEDGKERALCGVNVHAEGVVRRVAIDKAPGSINDYECCYKCVDAQVKG